MARKHSKCAHVRLVSSLGIPSASLLPPIPPAALKIRSPIRRSSIAPSMLTTSPTTSQPTTILIVEDDEILGQVLARVLSCAGRVARHVRTAGEAVELVRDGRPGLVLV